MFPVPDWELGRIVRSKIRLASCDILMGTEKVFKVSIDYILELLTVSIRRSYDTSQAERFDSNLFSQNDGNGNNGAKPAYPK